jgi:methylthioribose-1-phosphate isomerase
MRVDGRNYRTVWIDPEDEAIVQIIDQRSLPFNFAVEDLRSVEEVAVSIFEMHVRGAGCIGATAGYGMYLAALEARGGSGDFSQAVQVSAARLKETRPTAVNLAWAVDRQLKAIFSAHGPDAKVAIARRTAEDIANEDAAWCARIGDHGRPIIEALWKEKNGATVNVLTHCNAGWLAFVDHGSATAPIYAAHDHGVPVHVWVDETRPRGQGARLTAWELGRHGVPHTVITDTMSGYLMQQGRVDMVITGTDRTTWTGDVANKIGTYLVALAAKDNGVPFYVALPSSTFDWEIRDGVKEIPIEERSEEEVHYVAGARAGEVITTRVTNPGSAAGNFAFDITPARLITGLISERGVCEANGEAIMALFPDHRVGSK